MRKLILTLTMLATVAIVPIEPAAAAPGGQAGFAAIIASLDEGASVQTVQYGGYRQREFRRRQEARRRAFRRRQAARRGYYR